jgi:hypothetical protein
MYANDMVTGAENREMQVAFEVITKALNDY